MWLFVIPGGRDWAGEKLVLRLFRGHPGFVDRYDRGSHELEATRHPQCDQVREHVVRTAQPLTSAVRPTELLSKAADRADARGWRFPV